MTVEVPEKMLGRIRGLLAKAEDQAATVQEAEAYFVKAAELMSRYGVDRAMLAASNPNSDAVGDRVVVIEGAYHVDKQNLLAGIAEELGCQAVLRRQWVDDANRYEVHLFGYGSDLERVEVLFTSLLIQATNGMAKTSVPIGENARSFRVSWLTGFRAAVITRLRQAERLAREQVTEERREAGVSGPSVALVLVDRGRAVEAALAQEYPRLRKGRTRIVGGSGYQGGYTAGASADLGGPRIARGRQASIGQ